MEFKQRIYAGSVPQGRDDVEIEAVMSADGRRAEVYLKQRSGNLSSDRVLLGTLNDAIFFDQNPPAKAIADDGRIHFVFALNASVWYGRDDGGRMQPGAHWIMRSSKRNEGRAQALCRHAPPDVKLRHQ